MLGRVVVTSLSLTVLWGLVFGWLDGDIWTLANWCYAALVGCTFLVLATVAARRRSRI